MIRLLFLKCCLLLTVSTMAETILVKNIDELDKANKKAQPGDIIILQNGNWKDVTLKLNCNGTKEKPVTFKAETAGKVIICGNSGLRIGGDYIIVDGLYFTNGYAGKDPVINFRINDKQLANNCRVTNTCINNFNNPKRMEENYWVSFYGKNNRLDHCSFKDKKNMGVLLAVILDDDRSRENFHSIDHNYFGRRPPLASNSGEIIRVGVSQHCEFNSNTQITDNFFEHCDGETEIVSIKSCGNIVRGNLFKECQGGVVLRHGNYNTVENNVFLGNDKEGTGGVRVINKGQWVVNNFFYKCRGVDFRSPLSVMNGIPNSPANRYVQVTDAVIANNTFYECSSVSFCEGSDAERTLPPDNVWLFNNIFYNSKDAIIYKAFDKTNGFTFSGNEVSALQKQKLANGFIKTSFRVQTNLVAPLPVSLSKKTITIPDSLQLIARERLQQKLSQKTGFADITLLKKVQTNASYATGAGWFKQLNMNKTENPVVVKCATAEDVYTQLKKDDPVIIQLTSDVYKIPEPFVITKKVQFTGIGKSIVFQSKKMSGVFEIAGSGNLSLQGLTINGEDVKATHFICNSDNGNSNHYNLTVKDCMIKNLSKETGCEDIFYAYKYMVADSIVFRNNTFVNNTTNGIMMTEEKDDKGYYNAENIFIGHNNFTSQNGTLLSIYRGGNDESTMGPRLFFTHNKITDCKNSVDNALLSFTGVQVTQLFSNTFLNCNPNNILIRYKDIVRARHSFNLNKLNNSGSLEKNQFVTENKNTTN